MFISIPKWSDFSPVLPLPIHFYPCISIPKWSDFSYPMHKLDADVYFISIPKWSDFSLDGMWILMGNSEFQSQNGLILVLIVPIVRVSRKGISIPKWSDFSTGKA